MKRPRVLTRCVADHYHCPGERIVEFSSDVGGGLISLNVVEGELIIQIYRQDKTVRVYGAGAASPRKRGRHAS